METVFEAVVVFAIIETVAIWVLAIIDLLAVTVLIRNLAIAWVRIEVFETCLLAVVVFAKTFI